MRFFKTTRSVRDYWAIRSSIRSVYSSRHIADDSSGSDHHRTVDRAAPMTSTGNMGMKMADVATVAVKFVTVQPADFMSTRLMGVNVYNNQNETVGEIEDSLSRTARR